MVVDRVQQVTALLPFHAEYTGGLHFVDPDAVAPVVRIPIDSGPDAALLGNGIAPVAAAQSDR